MNDLLGRPPLLPDPGRERARPWPVMMRVVLGLLLLVAVGTLALRFLPGVTTRPISLREAAFTATSAVAVTGLSVLTTSVDFTPWGQTVLLLLIQVGGLGYMFAAALILRLFRRRVSLRDRLALSSSLGLAQPTNILRLMGQVLAGILIIEGVGALLLFLHWRFSGIVPADRVLFYAVFHAVSAFCNAGFDLFAGLPNYPRGIPGDSPTLLIMGGLVFAGGLGIPVYADFLERGFRRLSLHTRLTLVVVVVLVLLGWVGLLVDESGRGGLLFAAGWEQRVVHTWFQSVSARTAGFPGLEDFQRLQPAGQLLVMVLMFIGSAPASMGGGITTGTFVVLTLALWSYAKGNPAVQVRWRTIASGTVLRAGAVLSISLGVVMVASWLIMLTHPFSLSSVLFEVVSAFSTCGLSLGITGGLNGFGQLVIILMMIWGRLGALTIVTAILQRHTPVQLVQYPEETVLIG